MQYKLIASDIDGTLIGYDYNLNEKNIQAIKKAVDAGIKFVLCSGRSPSSMDKYAKILGLDKEGYYHIGYNGNAIYEGHNYKKRLPFVTLQKDLAIEITKYIKDKLPKANILIHTIDDLLLSERAPSVMKIDDDHGGFSINNIKSFDNLTEDVMKVIIMGENNELQIAYDYIKDKINGRFAMVFSSHFILEFMPLEVNKGLALTTLSNMLQIPMSQVVACGDNYNDLEMIQVAGLGVAVKNAVEPLKNIANYITKNDATSGAIAEVIEKILEVR